MIRPRLLAISYIAALGAGVLAFMAFAYQAGPTSAEGAGWLTAGFLALREIISKIENIVLGSRGEAVE